MSAWRIQRRTDSGATSKSAATSLIVRSTRRATVTTSRLNSGGNFLGIATSFPPDHVGRKRCQPNPRQTRRPPRGRRRRVADPDGRAGARTVVDDAPFRGHRPEAFVTSSARWRPPRPERVSFRSGASSESADSRPPRVRRVVATRRTLLDVVVRRDWQQIYWHAALTHWRAAEVHDRAAAFYDGVGDGRRAAHERELGRRQRRAAHRDERTSYRFGPRATE